MHKDPCILEIRLLNLLLILIFFFIYFLNSKEIYHVQRELLRERTRCRALEEELENPMNVHRWRKLEGSDPSTYELIQKIQALQKRLITKTEEVVHKELLIQEKEKLYKTKLKFKINLL